MRSRAAGARLTPYELGIPGRAFAERVFGEIRDEAESSGAAPENPAAFIQLEAAGRAVREIAGLAEEGSWTQPFEAFLFHAFHFHAAGERLYLLDERAARRVVEARSPSLRWAGEFPASAGYLQLPIHLFWSPVEEARAAEPVDGVFWTLSSEATLSLLVAMGIRADRPGMTLTELPPVELAGAALWPQAQIREEGADFAPTLPGGDLGRLYSIGTLGEVLKLVGRVFALVSEQREAPGPPEEPPRDSQGWEGSARPSQLPFRRIRIPDADASSSGDSTAEGT